MSNFTDDFELPSFLQEAAPIVPLADDDFPSLDEDEVVDLGDLGEDPVPEGNPAPAPEPAKAKRGRKPKADKAAEPVVMDAEPVVMDAKEFAAEVAKVIEQGEKDIQEVRDHFAENERAKPGNNSGVNSEQLKSIIERIESLAEDKQAIQGDISDVFAEAKGNGFDCKIIREVIKLRKKPAAERAEEDAILELYLWALGME